jgi:hypothetical protein
LSQLLNLKGLRYGKLRVLKIDCRLPSRAIRWLCECDCGNVHKVTTSNLTRGRTLSCKECGVAARGYKRRRNIAGEIPVTYWVVCSIGASTRSIEFNITPEYAYERYLKQDKKCALSKTNIGFRDDGGQRRQTASLDRIDSSKGYEIGNIQWVHKDINLMKGNLPEDTFISWCKLIAQNYDY